MIKKLTIIFSIITSSIYINALDNQAKTDSKNHIYKSENNTLICYIEYCDGLEIKASQKKETGKISAQINESLELKNNSILKDSHNFDNNQSTLIFNELQEKYNKQKSSP